MPFTCRRMSLPQYEPGLQQESVDLRIAFVYDIPYPWHKGGLEYILSVEASELAKKHEVHFFTMRWPGMKKEFVHKGVTYHTFGNFSEETAYRHGRRAIRETLVFTLCMVNLFRYDFDVVISNIFPVVHLPLVRLFSRMKNTILVFKVDEVWDSEYWKDYLGAVAGTAAGFYANSFLVSDRAYYVANSWDTADRLHAVGVDKKRIRVFAPVLDNVTLGKAVKDAGRRRKRIIFAGRFIKEKRLDKWIDAVKIAMDMDHEVEALLVGKGMEMKKISGKIRKLGLEKKIRIKPFFRNKKDLYKDIAESSVLLHMGEREGLGIIALESVALGTPVVLPDYSPIPKMVKDMCVVADEKEIPERIIDIIKGNGKYIKHEENLKVFSTSNVISFYDGLFKAR